MISSWSETSLTSLLPSRDFPGTFQVVLKVNNSQIVHVLLIAKLERVVCQVKLWPSRTAI